jgi:hypothetical protein
MSQRSCQFTMLTDLYSSNYVPLVNLIGVYFQIRDDYMNLQSTQVSVVWFLSHQRLWAISSFQVFLHQRFRRRYRRGKFPVVHSIHADLSSRQIISECSFSLSDGLSLSIQIFCRNGPPHRLLSIAPSRIWKITRHHLNRPEGFLKNLENQARDEIERLGGSPALKDIVDALHPWRRAMMECALGISDVSASHFCDLPCAISPASESLRKINQFLCILCLPRRLHMRVTQNAHSPASHENFVRISHFPPSIWGIWLRVSDRLTAYP